MLNRLLALAFLLQLMMASTAVGDELEGATPTAEQDDSADDDWADDSWADDDWSDDESAVELTGFGEMVTSARIFDDPQQASDFLLSEARFRLEASHETGYYELSFGTDFVADGLTRAVDIDVREVMIYAAPTTWFDLRVGRQVLTWGTGDLLFLNDLFPKDYVSFFTGRADEYLKAPSNAVRLGFYSGSFGVDLVWMPLFEPDRSITGERLSYFNPLTGQLAGSNQVMLPLLPETELKNGEGALRLHWDMGGWETALYGYIGFTKQPLAFDQGAGQPTHSRLAAYGLSLRGSLLGGIANLEGAFHHSFDDPDGDDPTTPNSEVRGLFGFERELVTNLTLGLQYYAVYLMDHEQLVASSLAPMFEAEELTHTVTMRLTASLLMGDLRLSLFTWGSPTNQELYLRPSIQYRVNDAASVFLGANIMLGEDDHTTLGQLENNANAFVRFRYSF